MNENNNYYTGKINEFVDWITGETVLPEEYDGTRVSSTNKQVSGGSIRSLLQEKLKKPFVTYDDEKANKIRFFSSKEAENLWKNYSNVNSISYDEELASKFELFNMERPSVYTVTGLSEISGTRYIIEGNSTSDNAKIIFTPEIKDAQQQQQFDNMVVQCTITTQSGIVTYDRARSIDSGDLGHRIRIGDELTGVYQYLDTGRNTVRLTATCDTLSAKGSAVIYMDVVRFSISSDFSGYYSSIMNGASNISFNLSVSRTITNFPILTTIKLHDGYQETTATFQGGQREDRYPGKESNFSRPLSIINTCEPNKKYTMTIQSQMVDSELGQTFKSNVLVYQFEVAASQESLDKYINIAYSVADNQYGYDSHTGQTILYATQYIPFSMNWGYHTDQQNGGQSVQANWCIRTGINGNYTYTPLVSILATKGVKPDALSFVSPISVSYDIDNSYLVANITENGVSTDVGEFPIDISENTISVTEANGSLKLSAYGKTNVSNTKNEWIDEVNNVTTTFSEGVPFSNTCGWNNNSLILQGTGAYATVNYCPFPSSVAGSPYSSVNSGCAFQIDFEPIQQYNANDTLIQIGSINSARIIITPESAGFYEGSTALVKTNIKTGERISLTFIINSKQKNNSDSGMVYIVNNGILERAAAYSSMSITDTNSNIILGGSNSSVRIYSIRAYRTDIEVKQALSNYMFDNLSNPQLLSRNDVYRSTNTVQYDEIKEKHDTILISTNAKDPIGLTNILHNQSSKQEGTVDIERFSQDSSKNFKITGCRIRNHGQSTLSYPITSMKFWLNKSNLKDEGGNEYTPDFVCNGQTYIGLNKNRYIMKDGAIPSNKFVLQANYADSSGVHNGGLLRLIQDTWYNALIDGEYKLRTAPQLFASGARITHNNQELYEDGSWVEGVYNIPQGTTDKNGNLIYNSNWANKTWPEIVGSAFPYKIRVSADSFPCVVFYKENEKEAQLLGQYVFMDDKKSDFVFGERSIYYTSDKSDPFCLKIENSSKDVDSSKVWDNKNVLQIEVVYPNSPLTGYVSKTVADSYELDENDNLIPAAGAQHNFREIYQDNKGNNVSYYWEQHFELIYPDEDDIKGDKFQQNSKFVQTVTPFLDFLDWITDCKLNYSTSTRWWSAGQYNSTLEAFKHTAHDHLDLYKLAAYYIFFLRFGLIDSVERNAQLKTYDGQHWHYEPWDMDIALGSANNGVIAYTPPLTRDTLKADGLTYAYSGRTQTQSNTLWDCLENWDIWRDTIVHDVAVALFDAGLTYENCSKMFDDEYVEKWSETLYNESGHYKYIDAAQDPKWRLYLNGARTSHRHWWLSKSMNFYDAKWTCGNFKSHAIQFRIDKGITLNSSIKLTSLSDTYFSGEYGMQGETQVNPLGTGLYHATPGIPVEIEANMQLTDKMDCFIYGATEIQKVDFSNMISSPGSGILDIKFEGVYDDVLGSNLKEVVLGAPTTPNIYEYPNENQYTSNYIRTLCSISGGSSGRDGLSNAEHIDIIGWHGNDVVTSSQLSQLFYDASSGIDRKNIKSLYAMGCDQAETFMSSSSGNNFSDLRLPDTITSIIMTDSSWQNISFWHTTVSGQTATYNKVAVPASINSIYLKGTSAKNECSLELVKSWINSIEAELSSRYSGAELEEQLLTTLSTKTLVADQIRWGTGSTTLSYNDLLRLRAFGRGGEANNLKGYIIISGADFSASQLSNIQNLFGDNVFNIGTTSSNLVVDCSTPFVRISIKGNPGEIIVDGNNIQLKEPKRANISANKFNLTSDAIENIILDGSILSTDYLQPNKYYWGISINQNGDFQSWRGNTQYAQLQLGVTGNIVLQLYEGDGSDYDLYIKMFYVAEEEDINTGQMRRIIQTDTTTIQILGVSYPTSVPINIQTKNSTPLAREFLSTQQIGLDIFGDDVNYHNVQSKTYVMYQVGQKNEFYLNPQGEFTGTINSRKYSISSIDENNSTNGYIESEDLSTGSNTIESIGDDEYLGFTRDSTQNGIVLYVRGVPLTGIRRYKIKSSIQIGGQSEQISYTYIMLMNDSSPLVLRNTSNALYNALSSKYETQYSASVGDFYKSNLLSLSGTLSFTDNSVTGITSLMTRNSDTVFNYLKYITEIDMTGCNQIELIDHVTGDNQFIFTGMPDLTSVILNGCTQLSGNLNTSTSLNITTLDLRGTELNVNIPENSRLTTLKLGTPTSVIINSPTVLNADGVTIENKTNLTTITLIGVSQSELCGFTLFNKLQL